MFGVIETTQQYIEGDERSRTNPGHGYPAHTIDVLRFHEFTTEADLLTWIGQRSKSDNYRVIKFEPVEIETKIVIKQKINYRGCGVDLKD